MQPTQPAIDQPTEDEVAAALAAVQALLSAEQSQPMPVAAVDDGWHNSAKLAVQQVRPARTRIAPRWQTIERLRRAIGGRYDVRSF